MRAANHRDPFAPTHSLARQLAPTAVVVADDNPLFRAELMGKLLARGCLVVEASDGAQLLEKLAKAADGESAWPDVVVLNMRLPYLSGLNVLSVLWELPERPATLLVSNLENQSIAAAAVRFGAKRVFRKPVDLDELAAAVVDAARGGKRREQRSRLGWP